MACLRNRIRKQKKSLLFPRIEKTTGTRKPFRIYSSNPAVGTDLVLEAALGTLFLLVLCPKTLEIRAFLASNPNKMKLFPFHRGGGLAGDVVDDAVDHGDLVDDADADPVQHVVGDPGTVGGHKVGCNNRSERYRVVICS